ncbi:hypothetical protein K8Z61_00510 [Nocardioides sp. TRM66260-LWL]|uniref:ATPase, T2SS/T4P/T4SS family n=1 Tax=Nocardioides sp. TRM66260-LWL TaxID=2874478 RepID=UPI001CC7B3A5|nr:ATPase, T2SS/T4P/T4SS family [Nocardioides sp. TRM66260-LWL]MBZ5732968.1 hypothetical protein [Nocardioides sp. TRM66260-LWL]
MTTDAAVDDGLARVLLRAGVVALAQVDLARERADALPLAASLISVGAVSDDVLARVLGTHHELPVLDRAQLDDLTALVDASGSAAVPVEAWHQGLGGVVAVTPAPGVVAIARLRDLQATVGSPGEPRAASADTAAGATISALLDRVVALRADDVVSESVGDRARMRLRIGEVVEELLDVPAAILPALSAELKHRAGLDPLVRHRPQDALVPLQASIGPVLAHVATTPTPAGERVVVRFV